MNETKSKARKDIKKFNKIKLKLTVKNKIKFSVEPTTIIIAVNAGLGNAVKRYELELALESVQDFILDTILPPKEPFAIILSKDTKSSEIIISKMKEFKILTPDQIKRPFVFSYCLYAESVADDVLNSVGTFNTYLPNDLTIINDFINESEELQLVEYFDALKEVNCSSMKKRTVMHFGYEFDYSNNRVDITKPMSERPIPDNCRSILDALQHRTGLPYASFDQLTVNMYQPGDGIPPHVDTHSAFSDEIISVSLGSDITMEWCHLETTNCTNVELKARSVCIMAGESRYIWQHSIASRKSDLVINKSTNNLTRRQRGNRVSLTFRKVKPQPYCHCKWPKICDLDRKEEHEKEDSISLENPSKLEEEFVHKVYDEIADHFSSTRHSMWPSVRNFIAEQKLGSIGADIGCGNGKYFPIILERGFLLGSDPSHNLCKIASNAHKIDVLQSNCLQLPYKDGCCDFFISIAVLHHLSTEERRMESVERMTRLLRTNGRGLIYVWAKEQKKTGVKSHYIDTKNEVQKLPSNGSTEMPLPVHVNRTEFASTDMLVPWCNKKSDSPDQVLTRYYHLFVEGELEALCASLSQVRVAQSWYDSGNWAVVIERI